MFAFASAFNACKLKATNWRTQIENFQPAMEWIFLDFHKLSVDFTDQSIDWLATNLVATNWVATNWVATVWVLPTE